MFNLGQQLCLTVANVTETNGVSPSQDSELCKSNSSAAAGETRGISVAAKCSGRCVQSLQFTPYDDTKTYDIVWYSLRRVLISLVILMYGLSIKSSY
jgi:hypothetical protein